MSAFADPRFRRLFAGQSLSGFGDTALYLTLGIWAKSLSNSNSAAGLVFFMLGLPVLFAPLLGVLADRFSRKRLQIYTNAVTALVVLSLVALRSAAQLWLIYPVALCYGVSFVILGSAGAGLLKDMLADDQLASANAALRATNLGLRIVAPLAGAGLYAAAGGTAVVLLDVATFAASIAALATITIPETSRARSAPEVSGTEAMDRRFLSDVGAGFRHIRSSSLLFWIMLTSATASAVTGFLEPVIFAVIGQGIHRPPAFFGVLASFQGAGAIAGGLIAARMIKRIGYARAIGCGMLLFAIGALALTASVTALVCAGAVVDGAGLVWYLVGSGTALQVYTPSRLQGRVSAANSMLTVLPQTISIAIGSVLVALINYRIMLLLMVAVTTASAILLFSRGHAELWDIARYRHHI